MDYCILSTDMFYINGFILKLEKINKLNNNYYNLYNVIYKYKKVGEIQYSFELDELIFSPINYYYEQTEYDLINNILKKNNYFDKKLFKFPTLSITNYSTFLEYKYTDTLNKEDYFIIVNNNDNLTEIIINSEVVAIITKQKYDRILTFLNNYENKETKMLKFYHIFAL